MQKLKIDNQVGLSPDLAFQLFKMTAEGDKFITTCAYKLHNN